MRRLTQRDTGATIVVATFNRARYLRETLDSLLAQTLPARRIVVVDDGSTDDTAAVLAAYAGRIDVLGQPNAGKAAALNLALPTLATEWVWFFDDDDIAEPDALERLVARGTQDDAPDFVVGDWCVFADAPDGVRRVLWQTAAPGDLDPRSLFVRMLDHNLLMLQATLVRRSAVQRIGGFDEQLVRSQDYAFLLALARDHRGAHCGAAVFRWRRHDGVRGTAAQPVPATQIEAGWVRYNRVLFERLYRETPLAHYLPPDLRGLPPAQRELHARARRMRVMARFGLWQRVAEDLHALSAGAGASAWDARLAALAHDMARPAYRCTLDEFVADPRIARGWWAAARHPAARRLLRAHAWGSVRAAAAVRRRREWPLALAHLKAALVSCRAAWQA